MELKESILEKCKTQEDLFLNTDAEYYFCCGNALNYLKKGNKVHFNINSFLFPNTVKAFDSTFKKYVKGCIANMLDKYTRDSKEYKIVTAIFSYVPEKLDKNAFMIGYNTKL